MTNIHQIEPRILLLPGEVYWLQASLECISEFCLDKKIAVRAELASSQRRNKRSFISKRHPKKHSRGAWIQQFLPRNSGIPGFNLMYDFHQKLDLL